MTQQTNGIPELNYSKENFNDMYEALKSIATTLANPLTTRTEPLSHRIHRASDEAWQLALKALAKVEK